MILNMTKNAPKIKNSWPSLSLWSLSSSFTQKQNERNREEKKCYLWNSNFYVKMAVYSLCVTSSTLFRFPESVYQYGGAFLTVYVALMIVLVQPFVYLELLLGQLYTRKLPVRSLHSVFKRYEKCLSVLLLLFIPHQHSIVNLQSNAFIDFGQTTSDNSFKWCSCQFLEKSSQNLSTDVLTTDGPLTLNCVAQNNDNYSTTYELQIMYQNPISALDSNSSNQQQEQFSTSLYFVKQIINPDEFGQWTFIMSCVLSIILIMIFVSESKFQNALSKVLLWMTLVLLPLSLVCLSVFQLNVSGRVRMLLKLLSIDWRKFGDISLWFEAVRLAILTSCIGMGLHTTISSKTRMSYRKFYQISWTFVLCVIGTSLLSTILLFSEIEILSILTRSYLCPDHFFPSCLAQGYSVAIFGSIFCKSIYWPSLKIFFWFFYILRLVAMSRVQVIGVETIARTLGLNNLTVEKNNKKSLRFCLRLAIVIFMQVGMTIPYIFKGAETILKNFHLYSGIWPLVIFLCVEAFHFSSQKASRMLHEDLYLSYRIQFPKFFSFQLRRFVLFILIFVAMSLLSYEIVVKLMNFWMENVLSVPEDYWPLLYGGALNILPFLVFVAISCHQFINVLGTIKTGANVAKKVLNDSMDEPKKDYSWRRERGDKEIEENTFFNVNHHHHHHHHKIGHHESRATIQSSRLRRPNVDNLGNLSALTHNKPNPTAHLKSSLPLLLPQTLRITNLTKAMSMSHAPNKVHTLIKVNHDDSEFFTAFTSLDGGDGDQQEFKNNHLDFLDNLATENYIDDDDMMVGTNSESKGRLLTENELEKIDELPPPPKFLLEPDYSRVNDDNDDDNNNNNMDGGGDGENLQNDIFTAIGELDEVLRNSSTNVHCSNIISSNNCLPLPPPPAQRVEVDLIFTKDAPPQSSCYSFLFTDTN